LPQVAVACEAGSGKPGRPWRAIIAATVVRAPSDGRERPVTFARILVTRRLPGAQLQRLSAAGHDVDIGERDRRLPRHELLSRVAAVNGLLCQLDERIDDELLDAAGPDLRVVSNFAVGVNNIDIPACTARGVWVGHTPGVLTDATADMAWALLLAAARRIGEGERLVRAGGFDGWAPDMLLGADLAGATLAIIGPGRIGLATARRSVGWRMKLLYVGRRESPEMAALGARRVGLDEALRRADVVSLHVPWTDETHHLLAAQELAAMKPGAILINTARGPIVDEAALAGALRSGPMAAAGLDVYEREPEVHAALLGLDNVVLAPHLGSATRGTREAMARIAVQNVLEVLAGRPPLHAVNLPATPRGPLRLVGETG